MKIETNEHLAIQFPGTLKQAKFQRRKTSRCFPPMNGLAALAAPTRPDMWTTCNGSGRKCKAIATLAQHNNIRSSQDASSTQFLVKKVPNQTTICSKGCCCSRYVSSIKSFNVFPAYFVCRHYISTPVMLEVQALVAELRWDTNTLRPSFITPSPGLILNNFKISFS